MRRDQLLLLRPILLAASERAPGSILNKIKKGFSSRTYEDHQVAQMKLEQKLKEEKIRKYGIVDQSRHLTINETSVETLQTSQNLTSSENSNFLNFSNVRFPRARPRTRCCKAYLPHFQIGEFVLCALAFATNNKLRCRCWATVGDGPCTKVE